MKRLLIVCVALVLLLSMAVPAFAAESKTWVYDDASLLSPQDRLSVNEAAEQAKAQAGCDFYVATYAVPLGYSSYQYRYTGEMFLYDRGLDYNTDLVLLVITLDAGQFYYNIYTYGEAMDRISTKEVNYILDDDDVFHNIKQGNLAPGCSAFLSLAAIG